jgi:hypothetical protein
MEQLSEEFLIELNQTTISANNFFYGINMSLVFPAKKKRVLSDCMSEGMRDGLFL